MGRSFSPASGAVELYKKIYNKSVLESIEIYNYRLAMRPSRRGVRNKNAATGAVTAVNGGIGCLCKNPGGARNRIGRHRVIVFAINIQIPQDARFGGALQAATIYNAAG